MDQREITLYDVPLAGLVLSICHSNIVQAVAIPQAHINVKQKVVLIFTTCQHDYEKAIK